MNRLVCIDVVCPVIEVAILNHIVRYKEETYYTRVEVPLSMDVSLIGPLLIEKVKEVTEELRYDTRHRA